ncbi:MAG: CHAT domain-containing protein, partial [Dehalococcoidia bacterium]
MAQTYHAKNIYNLLLEGFTEPELRRFCFYEPNFRSVYEQLPTVAGKTDVADAIVQFATSHDLVKLVLDWAKENNPSRYNGNQPYFVEVSPTQDEQKYFASSDDNAWGRHAVEDTVSRPKARGKGAEYYTYRVRVASLTQVQVEKRNDQNELLNEPDGKFQYKKYRAKIQPLVAAARTGKLVGKQVRELGEALFNSLFDGKLSQDFVGLYNQVVHDEKKLLRIELDIDEQTLPEVAALPWEFLCVPKSANLGTLWLGAEPNLIFSRRRRQWFLPHRLQLGAGEKLRIGLAIASPNDLGPVVYQTVLADLEKLIQEQGQRFELLPVVQEATPKELDRLLAKQPHIFHFIGHGQFNQLALVKPTKSALWTNADDFADLLNRHRPGVVLLQACEGGTLSDEQAFVGVASQVVAQNVPVVVAMQYKVSNGTASLFARHFYERLAEGLPIDAAAQEARREIALQTNMYNSREFATPVLFMRAPDGYLFEQSAKPPVPILDTPLLPAENLRRV